MMQIKATAKKLGKKLLRPVWTRASARIDARIDQRIQPVEAAVGDLARLAHRIEPAEAAVGGLSRRVSAAELEITRQLGDLHGRLDAFNLRIDELCERIRQLDQQLVEAEISSTPILVRDLGLTPTYLTANLTYPIFNPSVVRFGDEILFVSRSSNLLCRDDRIYLMASEPHTTVNIFHHYDDNLTPIGSNMLDDGLLRLKCKAAECGIEDIRLFTWKDALWAVAAGIQGTPDNIAVSQLLIRFDGWKVVDFVELPSPSKARIEKNWVPLIKEDRLFLIYNFEPIIVYEYRDGKIVLLLGSPTEREEFSVRGGTPLIPWRGNYVGLVHSQLIRNKRYYPHNFIVLNDDLELLEKSRPFYFQRIGVEYACGLINYKEDLLVSYGVSDRASAFCVLPSKQLAQLVVSMA